MCINYLYFSVTKVCFCLQLLKLASSLIRIERSYYWPKKLFLQKPNYFCSPIQMRPLSYPPATRKLFLIRIMVWFHILVTCSIFQHFRMAIVCFHRCRLVNSQATHCFSALLSWRTGTGCTLLVRWRLKVPRCVCGTSHICVCFCFCFVWYSAAGRVGRNPTVNTS